MAIWVYFIINLLGNMLIRHVTDTHKYTYTLYTMYARKTWAAVGVADTSVRRWSIARPATIHRGDAGSAPPPLTTSARLGTGAPIAPRTKISVGCERYVI